MEKEQLLKMAQKFLQKLLEQGYTPGIVCDKFIALNRKISPATISAIKTGKKPPAEPMLLNSILGFKQILLREKGLTYNETLDDFEKEDDFNAEILSKISPNQELTNARYKIYPGRLDVNQKIELYNKAKQSIIEIGIRLNNFNNYLSEPTPNPLKTALLSKLHEGVRIECYLADHVQVKRYFKDRSIIDYNENTHHSEMINIQKQLIQNFDLINAQQGSNPIKLYKYLLIPNYHATIIDGKTEHGEIFISPYLFGVSRANCPVTHITKKGNSKIYRRYLRSIESFTNAPNKTTQISPSK